jgi:hypothetical protein
VTCDTLRWLVGDAQRQVDRARVVGEVAGDDGEVVAFDVAALHRRAEHLQVGRRAAHQQQPRRFAVEPLRQARARQLARQRIGDAFLDQRAGVHREAGRLLQHDDGVVGERDRQPEIEHQRRVFGRERDLLAGLQPRRAFRAHAVDRGGADRAQLAALGLRQRTQLAAVDALQERVEPQAVLFGRDQPRRSQTRTPSSSSTKRWNR